MTVPTPAQIEAALKAYDNWNHSGHRDAIRAAISAAAEVGDQCDQSDLPTAADVRGIIPLAAAAEAAADKRANEGFADAIRNNAVAATIERCAQVAEDWFTLSPKYRTKQKLLEMIREE